MSDKHTLADERFAEIKRGQSIIDGLRLWREAVITTPLKSTPEMRARIRELATDRDDFDRAVLMVLDDIDALLRSQQLTS
jgi:hypothetical protein